MITCIDQFNKKCTVQRGSTLQTIYDTLQPSGEYPYVLAFVNNEIYDFETSVCGDSSIKWVSLKSKEGEFAYIRTLTLLLIRAANEIFPKGHVKILHSLGKALFCQLDIGHAVTQQDIELLEDAMRAIIYEDPHIFKETVSRRETLAYCRKLERHIDSDLLEHIDVTDVTYYRSGETLDYFFGPLLPNLKYLELFDLEHYAPGFLLRYPNIAHTPRELPAYEEMPKFAKVFLEANEWGHILNCRYVSQLNEYIASGEVEEIIDIAEALQDKKRANIADAIVSQKPKIKLVLIAGPSSAGKTTFTKRLLTQLRVNGVQPLMISLDDYFKNRDETPLLPDGSYDFESINALDMTFFSEQIIALFAGEKVSLPTFNFKTGKREFVKDLVQLEHGSPIIVEGLHALNDDLSRVVPRYEKYKISLGALTQITINDHNRISTSDTRLIRRIVRDHQFRGHNAESTLSMWANVRRGEEENIYPFQEDADVIFNSALIYELAVLKTLAEPLLLDIHNTSPYYHQARRLLRFLSPFSKLDVFCVPRKSILREFIGYK